MPDYTSLCFKISEGKHYGNLLNISYKIEVNDMIKIFALKMFKCYQLSITCTALTESLLYFLDANGASVRLLQP